MDKLIKNSFPVYLINLDRAAERRESSVGQLHILGIDPIIVSAFDGHRKDFPFHKYKHLSRGKWWDSRVFKPGAFACYLSHAKCWELIANGNAPYALILEDDISIDKEAIQSFKIEDDFEAFDILFVNEGVTRLRKLKSDDGEDLGNEVLSLDEILMDLLMQGKFSDKLTPGGYGYVISKNGAKKLLKMMEQNKVCMGVDYAIIFNSLNNDDIKTIKTFKRVPHYLQVYLDNVEQDGLLNEERVVLNSKIYNHPSLIRHNAGDSTIEHKVYLDFYVFDHWFVKYMKMSVKKVKLLLRRIYSRLGR